MRWAKLLCCCMFLAFAFAGARAPLFASDLEPPRNSSTHERQYADDAQKEEAVQQFCYRQRQICRKICNLRSRFDDRFDGCPQSCESREIRCGGTTCFRWTEPEFIIAERFGGYQCAQ